MANVGPDFLRLRLAVDEKQASLTQALASEKAVCREIQRIEAMDFAQVRAQNVQVMAQNTAILTRVEGLTNMVMAQNTAILTRVEGLTNMLAPFGDRLTGLGNQLRDLSNMFVAEKILNKARNRNVYARVFGVSQAEGALTEMYNCNEYLAPEVQVNDSIPGFPQTPAELVELAGPVCITILTALGIKPDDNDDLRTLRMKVGKAIALPAVFLLRS